MRRNELNDQGREKEAGLQKKPVPRPLDQEEEEKIQ